MGFQEKHKRSIVKSVTFRILVMAADFITITLITRRYDVAIWVIIVSNITSTILYYLHERSWNRIMWGRE